MNMQLTSSLRERLLGAIPGVQQEDGKTYAKFDRLSVNLTTGTVTFFWCNEPQFYISSGPVIPGNILFIEGIEGRSAIDISP